MLFWSKHANTIKAVTLPSVAAAGVVVVGYCRGRHDTSLACCDDDAAHKPSPGAMKSSIGQSKMVFLGTGSSTGCPRPLCAMIFAPTQSVSTKLQQQREQLRSFCSTSNVAMQGDNPRHNKNYRNNPSLLLVHETPDDGPKHILLDCGKTFREAALRWFPENGISSLDAVILTHEHADAAFGLDDLRGFQSWQLSPESLQSENKRPAAIPMPVYLSQLCLDSLSQQFAWLFPAQQPQKTNTPSVATVQRHVATFDVHVVYGLRPFDVHGLIMTPLPVLHGDDLVAFGYAFTIGHTNVIYLSDISRMLPSTLHYIQHKLPPTDILILDALHPTQPNYAHYSLPEALDLVKIIRPRQKTWLVGGNCDSYAPHDDVNAQLREECDHDVQFAHDGQVLWC